MLKSARQPANISKLKKVRKSNSARILPIKDQILPKKLAKILMPFKIEMHIK